MFLISFIIFSTAGIGKIIPIHGSMSGIMNNWRLEDLDTKYKFSLVIAINFLWLGFENFVSYQINCTIWLVTLLFVNNCLIDQKVILLGVGVGRMNEDTHLLQFLAGIHRFPMLSSRWISICKSYIYRKWEGVKLMIQTMKQYDKQNTQNQSKNMSVLYTDYWRIREYLEIRAKCVGPNNIFWDKSPNR